ncbi:MAG: hypothetical protein U9O98_05910, partial [Asgard group archaeon]|nr:hypothetical protein [Asgard group archaeon]
MRKKIVHVFKGKHLFLLLLFLTISSPFSFITNYSVRASTSNPVLSEDEILENMYTSLNSIYEIYNQKEGIFVWNIQDLDNLSRYGDLTDSSNGQQLIENDEYENWVTGLSQDLAVQYDLLKNNLYLVSEHFATKEEKFMFNREWVFTTESIIRWLYQNIATNNELMSILSEYSATGDGFGEYWNIFIREKYHEYVDATFSLLPDTFVLGTKILHKIEQMSYLSNFEKDRIRFLIEMINNWWDTINAYAVFDPG